MVKNLIYQPSSLEDHVANKTHTIYYFFFGANAVRLVFEMKFYNLFLLHMVLLIVNITYNHFLRLQPKCSLV